MPGESSAHQLTSIARTQRLTGIALFAALAIILNLTISVSAPYLPFLKYELWEIPIVAAFLLLGAYAGLSVAILNTIILLLVAPGAIPAGPLYNFAAVLFTLAGVAIGHGLARRARSGPTGVVISATGMAILLRVLGMSLVNVIFIPLPYPIGFGSFGFTFQNVLTILPLLAFFNATLVLYTIPLGYSSVKVVSSRYKVAIAYPYKKIKTPKNV